MSKEPNTYTHFPIISLFFNNFSLFNVLALGFGCYIALEDESFSSVRLASLLNLSMLAIILPYPTYFRFGKFLAIKNSLKCL